jgi:molybdopterin-guanine dinucleotide biosynthesis protein A
MQERMRVGAAILAGGRARRLGGVAKGLVLVGGEPMVARQLRVLAPLVSGCVIVAGEPAPYAAVAAAHGARLIRDRDPGRGPLAGLDAALADLDGESVILLGCDLPFIDRELIVQLRDRDPDARALVPRVDGKAQPLAARYHRSIAPVVKARLARGALRMMELLDELEARYVDLPSSHALFNVNTPEDVAHADELARHDRR